MKLTRPGSLGVCATLVLAGLVPAQGVLTYPDKLYYKFNEGAGNVVLNYANPGITSWQPVFANGGGAVIWDNATQLYGSSALNLNAADRLLTGYPTTLNASFTIECWIRTNVVQAPGCASTACNLQRLWGDYSISLFRCYVGFYNVGANFLGGGLPTLNTSTGYVLDGQWHHVALVYDQAIQTLTSYVDGNVDLSALVPAPGGVGTNFNLGGTGTATSITGVPFNGSLDEFRWWGEARSQAQIQAGMIGELPDLATRAIFSADRRNGPAHHLVVFKDQSAAAPGTSLTSWLWDFGDGFQSTAQHPCHVYTTAGVYNVSLTVTDSASGTDTLTFTGYVNVGNEALTVRSCGQGDLYMFTPAPPVGWSDGFTLISTATASQSGLGWFFGLYPDAYTFQVIGYPPVPGSPLHFANIGNPAIWPDSPLSFPPGTFSNLAGLVLDTVVLYRDASGLLMSWTPVSRARF